MKKFLFVLTLLTFTLGSVVNGYASGTKTGEEAEITAFDMGAIQVGDEVIDSDEATVDVTVLFGSDVTAITPTVTVSENAEYGPQGAVDFSAPVTFTVTNTVSDVVKDWLVTVHFTENTEAEITGFTLAEQAADAVINSAEATVDIEVVFGTDVTALTPTVTISENATVDPESGETLDFSDLVTYTVTAEDGTIKTWSVSVTVATENHAADILMFELDEQTGPAEIDMDEQEIHIEVEFGTDVTILTPSITISENATIDPMSGVPQDFTDPVVYTVTSEDLVTVKEWTVFVTVADDDIDAYPLPFAEDFTGVEAGTIPVDWVRTHENWGVTETNNAGGVAPEMRLNWSPSVSGEQVRLHSPLLNATEATELFLSFKSMVDWYSEEFDLMVQVSTDGGEEWTTEWLVTVDGDIAAGTEVVDLTEYAGEVIMLAFVFDGETTWDINQWYIDDVVVSTIMPVAPLALTTLLDATGDNLPEQIGEGGNARAAALYLDRYVVVPSREGGVNVWVWDMINPHLGPMSLDLGEDIIDGGLFHVNYVQTVGEHIYVSNMSLGSDAAHPFRVYRWSSLDAEPEVVLSADGGHGRLGDAFSIHGDPSEDGAIIAHVNSGGEGQKIFLKWNFVDGELQNLETPETITLDGEFNVNSFGVLTAFEGEDDLYLATGNGMGIAVVDLTGEVHAYIGTDILSTRTLEPNVFYHEGRRFLSYVVNNEWNADGGAFYQVIDITEGDNVVEAFGMIDSPEMLAARTAYSFTIGGGAAFLSGTNRVSHTEDGEVMILSHVVARGFILETTGMLPASYTVTLEANPEEGGTVEGEGSFYEGAIVYVSATPAEGYEFVNWTLGGDQITTNPAFGFYMPGADITLVANFEAIAVVEVATLAELRDMPDDGTIYHYTGDAVIVAMDDFRNRKFIQDATAAILIDDQPGVITTEYDLYDVITNVEGRINIWNNMVRFQPTANTAAATENTPVDPVVFAIDEVTADDQAKLIQFKALRFEDVEAGAVFANGTNYTLTDGENTFVLRTDFWDVDYIGTEIPVDEDLNIAGVMIQFQETFQIVPRFLEDMEIVTSVDDVLVSGINLFPNPARDQFTITASSNINAIVITDITGKVVFNDVVNNTEVRIENQFETGIYIVHIHTDEGVSMRKLQIQK